MVYHPHPLNKNLADFATIQPSGSSHTALPFSARSGSNLPSNSINNRNSRKNLRPLAQKKPSYTGTLNINPKVLKMANQSKIVVNNYRSGEKVPTLALQKLVDNSSNHGSLDMGLVSRRPLVARQNNFLNQQSDRKAI